jgi:tetratricopeptide (TPR) repeat protein
VSENPRIEELRRRVQKDPASIAFAQLAEEYRRAGDYEEAARVCRAGLERHPSYLSARVTLGRTLIELERHEEAKTELEFVLRSAPENLAAIRGLAEIHQRRGHLNEALRQYQTALGIAKHDPELEESVHDLSRQLGEPAPAVPAPQVVPPPIPLDIPADFVAAPPELETFAPVAPPPLEEVLAEPKPEPAAPAPSPAIEAAADEFTKALQALDALSLNLSTPAVVETTPAPCPEPVVEDVEHQEALVDAEPEPVLTALQPAHAAPSGDDAVADELESWLDSIVLDRNERALAAQGLHGNQEENPFNDLPDLPVNSNS